VEKVFSFLIDVIVILFGNDLLFVSTNKVGGYLIMDDYFGVIFDG